MKIESIDEFSLGELKFFRNFLDNYKSVNEMKLILDEVILRKEEDNSKNLNVKFDMNAFISFNVFDPEDLKILQINGINNLQELIDCDLENLIGMNESSYKRLSWARKAYDMSSYVEYLEDNCKK